LRGEVVRTFVANDGGRHPGIRYRTAVQFLETPKGIFDLLPELSEEPSETPTPTPTSE
jgi:hypothetical protein